MSRVFERAAASFYVFDTLYATVSDHFFLVTKYCLLIKFHLQDGGDGDSTLDMQKILPLINRLNFRNNEDLAYFLNSYSGGARDNSLNGAGWGEERLFRSPEMKRQIRYRQCYFNPISCFRK